MTETLAVGAAQPRHQPAARHDARTSAGRAFCPAAPVKPRPPPPAITVKVLSVHDSRLAWELLRDPKRPSIALDPLLSGPWRAPPHGPRPAAATSQCETPISIFPCDTNKLHFYSFLGPYINSCAAARTTPRSGPAAHGVQRARHYPQEPSLAPSRPTRCGARRVNPGSGPDSWPGAWRPSGPAA